MWFAHNCTRATWTCMLLRRMSMRYGSSNPQPHPAVLPHLRWLETPDMAQSGGGPQEALGIGWDTAADCGLRLTHRTENLAWPGTQKKKNVHVGDSSRCSEEIVKINLEYCLSIRLLLLLLLLPCHMVYAGSKVGGTVQLHCRQTLVVGLQHTLDTLAVWVLGIPVLWKERDKMNIHKKS